MAPVAIEAASECKGRAGCQIATLFERSLIDAIPTFPEKAGRAAGAASLFLQIRFARWRTRMTGATRLSFRNSWGCLCIRDRKRERRECEKSQCHRTDEATHDCQSDRFRFLHWSFSPIDPGIFRKGLSY